MCYEVFTITFRDDRSKFPTCSRNRIRNGGRWKCYRHGGVEMKVFILEIVGALSVFVVPSFLIALLDALL